MTCPRCERSTRYPNLVLRPFTCDDCGNRYRPPAWMVELSRNEINDLRGMAELAAVHADLINEEIGKKEANQRIITLIALHGFEGRQDEITALFHRVQAMVGA